MSEKILNLVFDNMQKIMFPEVWMTMGLSMPRIELMALLLIWVNGEIIMTQLAERLDIPMSTATGVVGRLAKKNYVERLVDESNRRIVTVRLTEKGKESAESVKKTVAEYLDRILNVITDEEKEVLYKMVTKIFSLLTDTEFHNNKTENTIHKIVIE